MTPKERFLAVLNFQEADRVPDFEFGAWNECFPIWQKQGMPIEVNDNATFDQYFNFEYREGVPLHYGMKPSFQEEILEEHDNHYIIRDSGGVISEKLKDSSTIPRYIEYPVKNKADFDTICERFDASDPTRYGNDFADYAARSRITRNPVGIFAGSLYGWIRDLMGVENTSIAFVQHPDLIEYMLDFRVDFILKLTERALNEAKFDHASWWEDMAFRGGPLISPVMFERFLIPRYKKITNRLREYGIHINYLDCDGNINLLIPGWLEAGIQTMFPVEVHAGSDPVKIREKWGRKVLMMGGVDKMKLIQGKKAIDEEIKKLKPLVRLGGFIPHVDHRVPPDVTYENYLYYLARKREMIFSTPVRP